MTAKYKVGIIGCGRRHREKGATGAGMSHQHAQAYKQLESCALVAVADIVRENAEAFIEIQNPDAKIYADYMEMMRTERLDIVSVTLWPHLHAKVVCDLAVLKPRAIHCEKPMDLHWDKALEMHQACKDNGVQLTFNHQRRFGAPFHRTRQLLDESVIGKIVRMEAACSNLYDWGTHWFNILFYFNGDTPAAWVMGQIDTRGARRVFGAIVESQGLVSFRFQNGVRATLFTGEFNEDLGCWIRVFGENGILEIHPSGPVKVRILQYDKAGWQDVGTDKDPPGPNAILLGIANFIECLESGETPLLSSDHAIQSSEVMFATYESARRRARVDLPLPPGKSALMEMIESGEIERGKVD